MQYLSQAPYPFSQPIKRFHSQERQIQTYTQYPNSSQQQHSSSVVQFFPRPAPKQYKQTSPQLFKVPQKELIHLVKPAFCKKSEKIQNQKNQDNNQKSSDLNREKIENQGNISPEKPNLNVFLQQQQGVPEQNNVHQNEKQEKSDVESSFIEQVEQLKKLFPKNTNISISSSSCLTSEKQQCKKALEIMQVLDEQLNKQTRNSQQQNHKLSFNESQQKKASNHCSSSKILSKAYYSSKDLSKLGSSYFGSSERSFQQQNRIKSLHESQRPIRKDESVTKQLKQERSELEMLNGKKYNFSKSKNEFSYGEFQTAGVLNEISPYCNLEQEAEQNNEVKQQEINLTKKEEQEFQITNENINDFTKKCNSQEEIGETKLQSNSQLDSLKQPIQKQATEQIQSEVLDLLQSDKSEFKQSSADILKHQHDEGLQIQVQQIIQFLQQQNNQNLTQIQQIYSTTSQSNCSSGPLIKLDVMQGSNICDQTDSSNQQRKVQDLNKNNNKIKNMGYFNYQISIISPVEFDSLKNSSAKKVDLENKEVFLTQQELRLQRLEEQLLQHMILPKQCDLLGIQRDLQINLMDLSKPLTDNTAFQYSEENSHLCIQNNQYKELLQQSRNSNQESKSQLLSPPLEVNSQILETGIRKRKHNPSQELIYAPYIKKQNKKKAKSGPQDELVRKQLHRANEKHDINNYSQHLGKIKEALNQKNKDLISPSLSSIYPDDNSSSLFMKVKNQDDGKQKKQIGKKSKENKVIKLDPYFEFRRQLNKNLDEYATDGYSMCNQEYNLHHSRKQTAMTQFGQASDENRYSLHKQVYQKTIEQVQQRLQQLQRK